MAATVAERIAELEQVKASKTADAAERYHQLIIDSTDGAEVDPEAAAQVLVDAGRTTADLEEDCKTLEKRRGWAKVINDADRHNDLAGQLDARIAEVNAERQRHWDELSRELHDLHVQRDAELNYVNALGPAKSNLLKTAWPGAQKRVDEVKQRLVAQCGGDHGLGAMEEHITTLRSIIKGDEQQLAHTGRRAPSEEQKRFLREHVQGFKEQLADAEKRLAGLKKVQSKLLDELEVAERELLEP